MKKAEAGGAGCASDSRRRGHNQNLQNKPNLNERGIEGRQVDCQGAASVCKRHQPNNRTYRTYIMCSGLPIRTDLAKISSDASVVWTNLIEIVANPKLKALMYLPANICIRF
jgi:hypothetical protein